MCYRGLLFNYLSLSAYSVQCTGEVPVARGNISSIIQQSPAGTSHLQGRKLPGAEMLWLKNLPFPILVATRFLVPD